MNWKESPAFIKGSIGEELVDAYLLRNGIVPYRSIADAAHPFDRLCASADKRRIFVVEVKTKPKREKYPDTGFNQKNLQDYLHISMTYGMDVFIYFVDEVAELIYGNELISALMTPRIIRHNGRELSYPISDRGIIYFPMVAMLEICAVPSEKCAELRALRRTKFGGGDQLPLIK